MVYLHLWEFTHFVSVRLLVDHRMGCMDVGQVVGVGLTAR